jgi:hypothetical protein
MWSEWLLVLLVHRGNAMGRLANALSTATAFREVALDEPNVQLSFWVAALVLSSPSNRSVERHYF